MKTPRTDEQVEFCLKLGAQPIGKMKVVSEDFARKLERERERNEAIDRLRDILKHNDGQSYKQADMFLERIGSSI